MNKILLSILLVAFYVALPFKVAVAQDVSPTDIPTDPHALVTYYAKRYKVSESKMNDIIKKESSWNTKAHNPNGEDSWGLVQINRKAHPQISVAQATNPRYAVRFLAYNLSKGKGRMWTTY